jgi:hypothetical protein
MRLAGKDALALQVVAQSNTRIGARRIQVYPNQPRSRP